MKKGTKKSPTEGKTEARVHIEDDGTLSDNVALGALTGVRNKNEKTADSSTPIDNTANVADATLVRINLDTDSRVFLLLDEGCTRTCHTPQFADHLDAALRRDGITPSTLSGPRRRYDGIGQMETVGRRSMERGSKLEESAKAIRDELLSNQLEKRIVATLFAFPQSTSNSWTARMCLLVRDL